MGRKSAKSAGRHGKSYWKEEQKTFGYQFMKKSGWSEGDGLGRKKEGVKEFLRQKENKTGAGLGKDTSNDAVFRAHQAMFNNLLARLNTAHQAGELVEGSEKVAQNKEKSGADVVTSTRRFVNKFNLYSKFRRAKDASSYSAKDMDAIFARKKASTTHTQHEVKRTDGVDEETGLVTHESTVDVFQYLKQKVKSKTGQDPDTLISGRKTHGKRNRKGKTGSHETTATPQTGQMTAQAYFDFVSGSSTQGRKGLGFANRNGKASSSSQASLNVAHGSKARDQTKTGVYAELMQTDSGDENKAAPDDGDDQGKEEETRKAKKDKKNKKKKKSKKEKAQKAANEDEDTASVVDGEDKSSKKTKKKKKKKNKKAKKEEEPEAETEVTTENDTDVSVGGKAKKEKAKKEEKKKKKKKKGKKTRESSHSDSGGESKQDSEDAGTSEPLETSEPEQKKQKKKKKKKDKGKDRGKKRSRDSSPDTKKTKKRKL